MWQLDTDKTTLLSCDFIRFWNSQPYIRNTPTGNIMLSSAMLFSGACISKTLQILQHMGILGISYQTFLNHQRYYLQPAIDRVWNLHQSAFIDTLKTMDIPLTLAGDGRADSPGHSAKYGSYTFLETSQNKILHVELVTVTEVNNSNQMEKEGMVRALSFLDTKDCFAKNLVTDRHISIRKYLREKRPDITHSLDVWHVAKGLGQKVEKLAKQKGMGDVRLWKKSINNHLYWCASSSGDCDKMVMLAKWESIIGHMQNMHQHPKPLFPVCLHDPLTGTEGRKKWFKSNTPQCERLTELLLNRTFLKDIVMLSSGVQTSSLEAFHAVVNHFAPKLTHFSPEGMKSSLLLAALHFNENSHREQATTEDGQHQFNLAYPKFKGGEATVKKVLVSCTFSKLLTQKICLEDIQTQILPFMLLIQVIFPTINTNKREQPFSPPGTEFV